MSALPEKTVRAAGGRASGSPGEAVRPDESSGAPSGRPSEQIEFVHVLFFDLVGYSLLKTDKGGPLVEELFRLISSTEEFTSAKAKGELILLPSGDGCAIVFLHDLAAPVRCALQIAKAVALRPEIRLRMGVNSGPAYWIDDINGNRIVAGAAINYAQRAMDCGDPGHILLTETTAQYLKAISLWADCCITCLGNYEVKHSEVLCLYNLSSNGWGSPKAPSRPLRARRLSRLGLLDVLRSPSQLLRIPRPRLAAIGLVALAVCLLILVLGPRFHAPTSVRLTLTNLTADGTTPIYSPQFSPDGQSLAYAGRSAGKWDIYVQTLEGGRLVGAPRNLTSAHKGDCVQPSFSPDGKSIVFSAQSRPSFAPDGHLVSLGSDELSEGVFVLELATGQFTRVASRGYNPVWLPPDGMRVVYAAEPVVRPEDRSTARSALYSVDIVAHESRQLFPGDAVQPTCSPNGKRIAFWYVGRNGLRDIATISFDGARRVDVTSDAYVDWNPVWSKDGFLYFSSNRGGRGLQLWRVRIDEESGRVEGRPEMVGDASGDRGHIAVSQDGRRIAFIEREYRADLYKVHCDPMRMQCAPPLEISRGAPSTRPDLSPDGRWIAYNSQDNLSIIGTDGFHSKLLLDDEATDRGPRWSPDGEHLAFFSNRSGKWDIWGISPSSSGLAQLTQAEAGSIYPVWSPGGDRLAYTSRGRDALELQTVIKSVGQASRPADLLPEPGGNEAFIAWSWSPNGERLAGYQQRSDGKFTGITVYSLKTGRFERVTHFGADPVWMSDGHRLLFDYKGRIYIVDSTLPAAESHVRQLVSRDPYDIASRGFALSKDDQWIYFSQEQVRNVLWLGTLDTADRDVGHPAGTLVGTGRATSN